MQWEGPDARCHRLFVGSRQDEMTYWDHIVVSLPARRIDESSRKGARQLLTRASSLVAVQVVSQRWMVWIRSRRRNVRGREAVSVLEKDELICVRWVSTEVGTAARRRGLIRSDIYRDETGCRRNWDVGPEATSTKRYVTYSRPRHVASPPRESCPCVAASSTRSERQCDRSPGPTPPRRSAPLRRRRCIPRGQVLIAACRPSLPPPAVDSR
jgi:hypothetical protein